MKPEKPSRNEDEYFAREDAELLRKQRERASVASAEAERKTHYMKCPKDGYDLVSSQHHGVTIETCAHCGGMWLDAGELETVAKDDSPNVITRVFSDALSSFRRSPRGADKHSSGPGHSR
ncbi:MAG: zf-TFIIB domain-containing protein [Gemmatimonadales bacterium]|jgi:Zn-finger nucleic acid-binding protein|nr:zf-TFIIB domain-containing protein [Gemmatimonadales bacterium]